MFSIVQDKLQHDDEEATFSDAARRGASDRFPDGTLDLFESSDFTIDCPSISLLDQIAKGSYGTVYKGSMNGSLYAIKIEDFHEDDDEQVNLLVELSMLQSYPHSNIVKFHGAGFLPKSATGEKMIMIVLELCQHGALRESLKWNLPWNLRTRICLDVALGLLMLHDNGIVHRDIKSTNILIDDNWTAKICDFSFACNVNSTTKTQFIYGTDEFMSPEIALALDFDQAADIFSFGLVICELITGKEPSASFLARKPQDGFALNEAELESAVLPGCPQPLHALALECCKADPADRPNASLCIEQLQDLLSSLGGRDFDFDLASLAAARPRLSYSYSCSSPSREGNVKYPGRDSLSGPSPNSSTPRSSGHRDTNTRLSYLEVQLQGLKAENIRLTREMKALVQLAVESGQSLPEPATPSDQSPSRRQSGNDFAAIASRRRASFRGTDSAGPSPSAANDGPSKSKPQARIQRRLSMPMSVSASMDAAAPLQAELFEAPHEPVASMTTATLSSVREGISREELEASLQAIMQFINEKTDALERRIEESISPLERIVATTMALTPQRPFESVAQAEVSEEKKLSGSPDSSSPLPGDRKSILPDEVDLNDPVAVRLALQQILSIERDVADVKVMLIQQLKVVDPTGVESGGEEDRRFVDVDLSRHPAHSAESRDVLRDIYLEGRQQDSTSGPYSSIYQRGASVPHAISSSSPQGMSYSTGYSNNNSSNISGNNSPQSMQPSANLSRALGSFLDVIQKCSGANEKTKDIISSLDRSFYAGARHQTAAAPQSPATLFSSPSRDSVKSDMYSTRDLDLQSSRGRSQSPSPRGDRSSPAMQSEQDVLSHRKSSKAFSFGSSSTMRGPLKKSPGTDVSTPMNDTWRDAFTPTGASGRSPTSNSIASRMSGIGTGRLSLGSRGTPRILEADSTMAKEFFRADPTYVKMTQTASGERYQSPTNRSSADVIFPERREASSTPSGSHAQSLSSSIMQRSSLKHQDTHDRVFVSGDGGLNSGTQSKKSSPLPLRAHLSL